MDFPRDVSARDASIRDASTAGRLLARAQGFDEGSRLVAVFVLLVTAVLHALVLTPWTKTLEERENATAELSRLAVPLEEVAALETSIKGARETFENALEPALERLADDLVRDLRRVAATRLAMRRMLEEGLPEEDESTSVPLPGDPSETPSEAPTEAIEPFAVDDVDWIFDIGRAESRDELLTALRPLVETRVIGPRYSTLEARWTSEVLPRVEAHLDQVAGVIPHLRGALPEHAAALDELAAAVAAERRAARDLRFGPPERDDWWTSAAATADEVLSLRLDPAVRTQILEPLALDQLTVTAARTETAWRTLLDALEKRRVKLAATAEEPGLPGSQAWAARFSPLVLGLLMAVFLVWRAARTRELGLLAAAALAETTRGRERGVVGRRGDGTWLREWLFVRSGGSTRRAFALRVLAVALFGFAWIALAAWQVGAWNEPPGLAAATGGGVVFAFALGYAVAVARRARARLLPSAPSTPAAASASTPETPPRIENVDGNVEEDGDPEGLEGLSLR